MTAKDPTGQRPKAGAGPRRGRNVQRMSHGGVTRVTELRAQLVFNVNAAVTSLETITFRPLITLRNLQEQIPQWRAVVRTETGQRATKR